jgi:hypothetical protein
MAILASDTFDRADTAVDQSEHLGANWLTNTAGKFFKILTNEANPIDHANDLAERYSAITWPNDQYSKVTMALVSIAGLGTGCGPCVRMSTSGTTQTYYLLACSTAGWQLQRFKAGVFTSIASSSTTTFANGDIVELQVTGGGSTVTFVKKKNGTIFESGTTDASSPILTGAAGIGHSSSTGSDKAVTSWEGGSLSVSFSVDTASFALSGQQTVLRPGSTTYLRYRK